ncbi:dihydroorotase [Cupriavidus basilensis OR16]|uniref:Dihydroorotase n=1 Tax=Cupriavidus basilensis OR16 TaxID=1127483 RepID=H1SHL9_9BURK|nr:dihydroorotase [Cupriavidus basilensis OR16]
MTQRLTLRRPDDCHLHLRDGDTLRTVLPHTARQFARAIVMPNLKPPVATVDAAHAYRERIRAALPPDSRFVPLMTCYLCDATDPEAVRRGFSEGVFTAVKLYPAGATTHSEYGVSAIGKVAGVLKAMQEIGMPLLIHGESTDPAVDVFDREATFIEQTLKPLLARFPGLKVVLEHITTEQAAEFVGRDTSGRLAATITPQHLMFNRNAMFTGGIRPHFYCLPVLKRERHRLALRRAATSGSPAFFLAGLRAARSHGQGGGLRLRRHLQRAQRAGSLSHGL